MADLREAYLSMYKIQLDEGLSDDEKEMRRLAAQERRAGKSDRMSAKVASKYADSEARSAGREDKKSKGKHIAGMADSFEPEGEQIDEISAQLAATASMKADEVRRKAALAGDKETAAKKAAQASRIFKGVGPRRTKERMAKEGYGAGEVDQKIKTDRAGYRVPEDEAKAARERIKAKMAAKKMKKEEVEQVDENRRAARAAGGYKDDSKKQTDPSKSGFTGISGSIKEIMRQNKEIEARKAKMKEEVELDERALDSTEKSEKERIVKGMKKSAKDFKSRYGKDAKSVMYATATKRAKERMDTSKSDLRYGVEK